ncbi:MAG: phenylalanine--tRNA ligase subunit beta [Chloroflexi bacterium]|nr:phenylalanine--tRNA ligase subunit beta [Chloroflexota bacterium]
MKVSIKWLREYVDVTLPVEELAARLTASGTEVGSIVRTGAGWEKVQVASITRIERHPNADRLQLATIELGNGERTVVCGAPNIQVGQRVPYAHVGAMLIDGHTGQPAELQAARIRGVVSEGMLCSEKELGISEAHEGILILPEDAPVGAPLADYLGDTILDLDVTPNRPDCYSVLGVAREVAALTGQRLREPDLSYGEEGPPIAGQVSVEILDPDLCPRYTASLVLGVKIGPSPGWMQERLVAAGMRPINNVVDITNYVMLELGQPLHAFDFAQVRERKIVVRRARPAEAMVTLDGADRSFTSSMLLICDGGGPVAVGGVIGGSESEVTEHTTDVLLEAANFHPINIRQTEAALRLRTEASLRFDKGLHPTSAEEGLRRATKLLVELCGGVAARGMVDVYPGQEEPIAIHLTQDRLRTLLGTELSMGQVFDILTALGCHVAGEWEVGFLVTPPWWRPDLRIPEDLAEELARIIGYDNLPTTMLGGAVPHHEPDPLRELKERLRDLFAAAGMQEVITYSLTSVATLQKLQPHPSVASLQPIKLANPMSAEQEYLRTSLRPSLLGTLAANQRQAEGNLQLFEVGRVYLPRRGDLPEERDMVVGLVAGAARDGHWSQPAPAADFYDTKGVLEAVFDRLGVVVEFRPAADANLAPGRTAAMVTEGDVIGVLGELVQPVAEAFDLLRHPVYLFELDVARLLSHVAHRRQYQAISRFPAVTEDLAVVVDAQLPAALIEAAIRQSPLVTSARLFDVYSGQQVPAGMKSLAFSVIFQSAEGTLTGEQVAAVRRSLLERLAAQYGVRLRE